VISAVFFLIPGEAFPASHCSGGLPFPHLPSSLQIHVIAGLPAKNNEQHDPAIPLAMGDSGPPRLMRPPLISFNTHCHLGRPA